MTLIIYEEGKITKKNLEEAKKWYKKSFESGYDEAGNYLNRIEKNSEGGCFITTATCLSLNKTDECYELMMFRKFRDEWLLHQVDGINLIKEYYTVAPIIVKHINECHNSKEIYFKIMKEYLYPCLHFIEKSEWDKCKKLYIEMVNDLNNLYGGALKY